MAARRRTGKKVFKAFLPIMLLLLLVVVGALVWIGYGATHPPQRPYLVTPEKFKLISDRGLKVTDETWTNRDGTKARGWLLRGAENAPAVVLLHRYGADRSWLLNLGVKINEATNFTVLWPDLRGHGENPPVAWTSFGAKESADTLAALDYLRGLKTPQGRSLASASVGLYGVEMGAYAALLAGTKDANVRALVLDSVPTDPDDLARTAASERVGMSNGIVNLLARTGTRLYFLGSYESQTACAAANGTSGGERRVLLLSGADAGRLRDSTNALAACFPDKGSIELQSDLPLSGFNLASATGTQGEAYDRRVIEFFDKALRGNP
ncbi:MAG: alpha/beta hydrolase family protein [Pyrinomonadaceae bacterium]